MKLVAKVTIECIKEIPDGMMEQDVEKLREEFETDLHVAADNFDEGGCDDFYHCCTDVDVLMGGGKRLYLPDGTFEHRNFYYRDKDDIIRIAKRDMESIKETKAYDVIHYFTGTRKTHQIMPLIEATKDGGVYDCENSEWIVKEE